MLEKKAINVHIFFEINKNNSEQLIINSNEIIILLMATGCKAIKCENKGNVIAKIRAFILLVCINASKIITLIGSAKYKGIEDKCDIVGIK